MWGSNANQDPHNRTAPTSPTGSRAGADYRDQRGERSTSSSVALLFSRLQQDIEDAKPPNVIHFIVNFLCKNYPEHLHGFASIWNADPDLERERMEVCNFFKAYKISTQIAAHFTNAGYDTLETLTTLAQENLADIEAFNNVKWLPGHKVRLQHIFQDITHRVRAYRSGGGIALPVYEGGLRPAAGVGMPPVVGYQGAGLGINDPLGSAGLGAAGRAYSPPRYGAPAGSMLSAGMNPLQGGYRQAAPINALGGMGAPGYTKY